MIDKSNPLSQYYVGYGAFDPDANTGFTNDYNPNNENQVRHFLAGASIAANYGLLGIIVVIWREPALEDDNLYWSSIQYYYYQLPRPLRISGDWVRVNLAK